MFIHTGPSGSNDTTSFTRKVHAFVTSSSSLMSPNNITVLRGTSFKSVSMQASQISSQEVRTRSMIEVRRLNRNKPHRDAKTTRRTTHGPWWTMCRSHSLPTSRRASLSRKARQNNAPHPTGRTRVMQCRSNVQLSETLRQTCLPVAHFPTVHAHQSVTLVHPASSPVSAKLLERVA